MTPPLLRKLIVGIVSLVDREPRIHRIPFGVLKGRHIFTTFAISPRMYLGIDEPWVAKLASQLVRRGDIVYDVGAHIGYTSLLFAHNHARVVHSFEILPSTAQKLAKTIAANDFDNIIMVHNIGLGSTTSTIELVVGPTAMTSLDSQSSGLVKEICHVTTLDQYVIDNQIPSPHLIKVDIEGAEIEFLRGGKNLIHECKPIMIIGFHSLGLLQEGVDLLKRWGYELSTEHETAPIEEQLQSMKVFHQNVVCMPK